MNTDALFYWMKERQAIYRRREDGSPRDTWTKDPILQQYRFCNVFREQDRVTKWVKKNWRDPFAKHKNLPMAMVIARSINFPDSLEELGFPINEWDRHHFLKIMNLRKQQGKKLVTSSHLVHGGWNVGGVANRIALTIDAVSKLGNGWVDGSSLQQTFEQLLPIYGIGRFTAYEVVTDLRHTKWLNKAKDIFSWCNIGQGSQRGLNRVMGRKLNSTVPQPVAVCEVKQILGKAINSLSKCDKAFTKLEMRDIEHSLCELDKYLRIKEGHGQLKVFQPKDLK